MKKPSGWVRTVLFLAACLTATGFAWVNVWQDEGKQDPKQKIERRDAMRVKLMYSQNVVEGLSTKNFQLVAEAAKEIEQIMRSDIWQPKDSPEYERLNGELRMSADRLKAAAEKGELEAAALRYFDLTLSCIDCHEYLRNTDF